jgi:hypothetical protein
MSEDMVERVAKAISRHTFAVVRGKDDCGEWEDMPPQVQKVYMDAALAALRAMIKPTDQMLAAYNKICLVSDDDGKHAEAVRVAWQTMVAAAMCEGPESVGAVRPISRRHETYDMRGPL